jgi:hypothetical protein
MNLGVTQDAAGDAGIALVPAVDGVKASTQPLAQIAGWKRG